MALMIAVGGFASGWLAKPCPDAPVRTIVERDTLIVTKAAPPLVIHTKPKIRYVRDTLILTRPFEARIDTIVKFDTVKALYRWPENVFDLTLWRRPDSIYFQTVHITTEIEKKRPWYEIPAYTVGGCLVGFLLGSVK